jgi:hypothetical protein
MGQPLRILSVHGVGLHDVETSWQKPWTAALDSAMPGRSLTHDFLLYDDAFRAADIDADAVARAILLLLKSGLVHGLSDLFRRRRGSATAAADAVRALPDRLRWTAGMIVQWVEDEGVRRGARRKLEERVAAWRPDVIVAHSLGSLVSYDALARRPDLCAGRCLVTLGSQVGNPFVRASFGGRLVFPRGLRRWYHLFNPHDDVFTARVRLMDADAAAPASAESAAFEEVDTPLISRAWAITTPSPTWSTRTPDSRSGPPSTRRRRPRPAAPWPPSPASPTAAPCSSASTATRTPRRNCTVASTTSSRSAPRFRNRATSPTRSAS